MDLGVNDENVFGEKIEGVEYFCRIGIYGITTDGEGKVATIKTSNGYFLPGGGIEKNETHVQCLHREFLEETGYMITIGQYIGEASLYHTSKKGRNMYGIGYFYFVKLEGIVANKIEQDHELVWLDPRECADKLFLEHQAWAVSKALL